VFTGLRYSAAVALVLLVAVEIVGSQSGLGFFLIQSQSFLLMPEMFAAIAIFGAIGFFANGLLLLLERRVITWHQEVGAEM
jgi:ABC-type nitrate/sulfonate/bicarbonate transport system permease component